MNWPADHGGNDHVLSQDNADQILANVFEYCHQEPNHVSLEKIKAHRRHRRILTALCWVVLIATLIAALTLPVLLATAQVEISWVEGTPPGSPVLQIFSKSLIPIESITAHIDGSALTVRQVSDRLYYLYPDRNGRLVLSVTLVNRQSSEAEVEVVTVDNDPPELVSSDLLDGELTIWFRDADSDIDFSSIYAMDLEGGVVYPLRCDRENMSATFAFPDDSLNIFVSDSCGNMLQLVLTVE